MWHLSLSHLVFLLILSGITKNDGQDYLFDNREVLPRAGRTLVCIAWFCSWLNLRPPCALGMVQVWVAHFVTPLKCTYGKYDWQVTSQKPHKKHKSPNKHDHHGGEAACPSSGVNLMNPRCLRGGRPCACLFQCRRQRNLKDSIN